MPSDKPLFAYLNGEIKPLQDTYLHVSDLAVQRGYGIFDYFKVAGTTPLFLDAYLDRFYTSANLMELPISLSRTELKEIIKELAERNNLSLSGIKMILTGGYSENGYEPGTPNLLLFQKPLSLPDQQKVETGIKVITYEYAREIALAKTINYSTGIRLIKQLKEMQAEDVLYFQGDEVLEFPRCNFFLVMPDNTILTPEENVLQGITRLNVLQVAGKKYKVIVGKVPLSAIAQAKEAFLTSTTKRILPIVQIDDKLIGTGKPGPVSLDLLRDLIALENTYLKEH